MNYVLYPLSGIGLLSIVLFLVGFWLDFREFDPTRGGYEPPYEGVVGEPIDWFSADRTPTGLARRGRVVNTLVNGTTGMISFEIYGLEIPVPSRCPTAHWSSTARARPSSNLGSIRSSKRKTSETRSASDLSIA